MKIFVRRLVPLEPISKPRLRRFLEKTFKMCGETVNSLSRHECIFRVWQQEVLEEGADKNGRVYRGKEGGTVSIFAPIYIVSRPKYIDIIAPEHIRGWNSHRRITRTIFDQFKLENPPSLLIPGSLPKDLVVKEISAHHPQFRYWVKAFFTGPLTTLEDVSRQLPEGVVLSEVEIPCNPKWRGYRDYNIFTFRIYNHVYTAELNISANKCQTLLEAIQDPKREIEFIYLVQEMCDLLQDPEKLRSLVMSLPSSNPS